MTLARTQASQPATARSAGNTSSDTARAGQIVVALSDIQVSNDPEAVIVTYALGSCIAVILYDPVKTAQRLAECGNRTGHCVLLDAYLRERRTGARGGPREIEDLPESLVDSAVTAMLVAGSGFVTEPEVVSLVMSSCQKSLEE